MISTIGDILSRNRSERPDELALIDGSGSVTWASLESQARKLALGLNALGVKEGCRVASVVRNSSAAVEVLFGLAVGGVIGVPINYGLTADEVRLLFGDSNPHAVILDAEFVEQFGDILERAPFHVIIRGEYGELPPAWLRYEDVLRHGSVHKAKISVSPTDIRTIRYTSGTTASPKGVLGTHRQILSSIANFFEEVPVPASGPFLQMLPLFSGAGIWMAFAAAVQGVANVIMPSFNAREALKLVEKHGVAHACGVPTMLRRLCDELEQGSYDVSSLKLFGYTGASMPASVIRRAMQMLPCGFYQGFGGGELGGLVSYLMPDDHRAALAEGGPSRRLSSVGRAARYAEIVVRDLKTGGVLKGNEVGEITVRSPSNFSGYHNRPEETKNTLRGEWVFTGDVGYIDDDGFLYVVDRVKDMIITGGMNVSSAEVESVLAEHPSVQAAAAIGMPDEEWGEVVTGVVTVRPGQSLAEDELLAFCRQRLAGYKSPKAIKFVDALPTNSIGKVLKRELRDRLAGMPRNRDSESSNLSALDAVMKWKPDRSQGPRGFLVETERFASLDVTMPIEGVAKITLNRPAKLNAFDVAMIGEIRSAIWRMSFDDRVKVIVFTGAGRGFCAGRDIQELREGRALPLPQYRAYTRSNHDMLNDLEAIEKPVIAAINGPCAGGGVELAASCDFRFASTTATFSLPEIFIGVIPASGACSRMIQMIGIENVKDLVMTGRTIDAEEARSMGFVRRVSEPDKLEKDVLDFAQKLMRGAPLAVGVGKHVINTCQNVDTETGRIIERLAQSSLVGSVDSTEGIKSFLEKRPPRFAGR